MDTPATATQPTAEQVAAARAETAAKAAAAEKAKADKAIAAAAAKAAKAAAAEKAKADKATKAAAGKVVKDAAKVEAAAAKTKASADAKLAKDANRQPEQNGVRRPNPMGLCGKAWAIFDALSTETKSPALIAPALERAEAANLNLSNVRAEYARWRKFHGIVGRLVAPAAPDAPAPATQAPATVPA